jgi:hypothetical protein
VPGAVSAADGVTRTGGAALAGGGGGGVPLLPPGLGALQQVGGNLSRQEERDVISRGWK